MIETPAVYIISICQWKKKVIVQLTQSECVISYTPTPQPSSWLFGFNDLQTAGPRQWFLFLRGAERRWWMQVWKMEKRWWVVIHMRVGEVLCLSEDARKHVHWWDGGVTEEGGQLRQEELRSNGGHVRRQRWKRQRRVAHRRHRRWFEYRGRGDWIECLIGLDVCRTSVVLRVLVTFVIVLSRTALVTILHISIRLRLRSRDAAGVASPVIPLTPGNKTTLTG